MKRTFSVFVLVAVMIAAFIAWPEAKGMSCTELAAWAVGEAGNLKDRPVTIAQMNGFQVRERKAIFRELSTAQKVMLWQEQFSKVDRSKFSAEQLRVIDQSFGMLTAAYNNPNREIDPVVALIAVDVKRLFNRAERRIFYVLGKEDPVNIRRRVTNLLPISFGGSRVLREDCTCHFDDDCPSGSILCSGADPCDSSWFGCGPYYLWGCEKTCYFGESNG